MRISRDTKQRVAERASRRCEYCRCAESHGTTNFSAEHIFPVVRGGLNDMENLAFSCQGCNQYKFTALSGIDPLTARKVKLFHPRRLRWNRHFEWSEDNLRIIGKTPTGRATVERLKLNRFGVVNLRHSLIATGNHPPPDDEL